MRRLRGFQCLAAAGAIPGTATVPRLRSTGTSGADQRACVLRSGGQRAQGPRHQRAISARAQGVRQARAPQAQRELRLRQREGDRAEQDGEGAGRIEGVSGEAAVDDQPLGRRRAVQT